jgi:hypothetical protein
MAAMNDPRRLTDAPHCWPALPLAHWQSTRDTLHLWTQIVGKIRLALTPRVNHFWNVPLHVDARGLTTGAIPYADRAFELRFDFVDHRLVLQTTAGEVEAIALAPRSVASFYRDVMRMLRAAGIDVTIWTMPVEIPDPVRFDDDDLHASYDADAAARFWRILVTVNHVFDEFRSRFIGKSSPVHFFWGSFDLAVTRFSGRRAPERPGADAIMREAYSHEVSSVGFWPGGGSVADAAFYAYAAPEPSGFRDSRIMPAQAAYDSTLSEFIVMYDDVRAARAPTAVLLAFCETTYAAAADLAGWNRAELERPAGPGGAPRNE